MPVTSKERDGREQDRNEGDFELTADGQRLGRPTTAGLHADKVRTLHRAGVSKAEIARRLQIGRTSVRRMLG